MKYICLGYFDKGKHEGMTEDAQLAATFSSLRRGI